MRNQFSKAIITDDEAINLLNTGWSLAQIGRTYGIDPCSLSKRLKKKNIIIVNKQNERGTKHDLFEVIDSEEKAYWLGFLYADGYIGLKTNCIEIGLKESDIGHLEKFKIFIGANNNFYHNKKTKSIRYSFYSKKMKLDLIKLGCIPQKSEKLSFPTFLCEKYLTLFIRGYFDGDGCLTHVKRSNGYTPAISFLGTKDMLLNIQKILGYSKTLYKASNKKMSSSFIFEIKFGSKDSITILNTLYTNSVLHLDRKYKKFLIFKQNNYAVLDKKLLEL